jgi:polar amino acid transport system substrate-binding protein
MPALPEFPSIIRKFFSDPVIDFENVAITLSSKNVQINSLSDLSDKKIVAFSNAQRVLGPQFAQAIKNNPSYSEVGDQASQLPMLDAGRGDVILLDLRAFQYFARLLHGKTEAKSRYAVHHLFKPTPRLLGFHKSEYRDQFNKGLKAIQKMVNTPPFLIITATIKQPSGNRSNPVTPAMS